MFLPNIMCFLTMLAFAFSQSSFRPLKTLDTCIFTKESSHNPNCSLFVDSTYDFKSSCIRKGVIRVVGEYNILKILCTADYGLDFFYTGHQPTEAITVDWWKSVTPGSFGSQIEFNLEIVIRSVKNLFEHYTTHEPHRNHSQHIYSRSGEYTVQNVFNDSLKQQFFLYLEEESVVPSFLRNYQTNKNPIIKEVSNVPGKYAANIPCVSSYADSNISVLIDGQVGNFLKTLSGLEVELTKSSAIFQCHLKHGNITDVIQIGDDKTFGLEDYNNQTSSGDAAIEFKSSIDSNSTLHIQPWCRVSNIRESNLHLATIPSDNFGNLRMLREFVFPKYSHKSYSVRLGSFRELLPREFWTTQDDELSARFGTTFCASGNEHRLIEYGTSHGNGEVVKIPYGLDWTFLERDKAPIHIFLRLEILPESYHNGQLFANTNVSFACRIHEAVMVKPILWFSQYKNGSVIEEVLDHNLKGPFSYFTKFATPDISGVYCAATFWYKELWRNISTTFQLQNDEAPEILNNITTITFRKDSSNKLLSCKAQGNPAPNISWFRHGIDISANGVRTPDTLIVDLIKTDPSSSQAGEYICRAVNLFGIREKKFVVEFDEGSQINYWVVAGIPTLVVLLVLVLMIFYVKRWQEKQIGLTRAEIEEFKRGHVPSASSRETMMNGYAHNFAQAVPYANENEVSKRNYLIDFSTLLGSGAYGSVYKGLLKGIPVAVKTVNENADKTYLKALLSELKIMIYLGKHPNVAEFLGSDTSELEKGKVFIFVKLYTEGSLDSYLLGHRDFLIENKYLLAQWALQICAAMHFLETKRVIHGDLAARNVLLCSKLVAKVSDFGLSRQLVNYADYVKKNQEPLPWRWMALESLRDLNFSHKSDVWAFGVTLWEILSLGEIPYPGMSYTLDFVKELTDGLRLGQPNICTRNIYISCMCACWHVNPKERPTFQTLSGILSELTEFCQPQNGDPDYKNVQKVSSPQYSRASYLNEFESSSAIANFYSNTKL